MPATLYCIEFFIRKLSRSVLHNHLAGQKFGKTCQCKEIPNTSRNRKCTSDMSCKEKAVDSFFSQVSQGTKEEIFILWFLALCAELSISQKKKITDISLLMHHSYFLTVSFIWPHLGIHLFLPMITNPFSSDNKCALGQSFYHHLITAYETFRVCTLSHIFLISLRNVLWLSGSPSPAYNHLTFPVSDFFQFIFFPSRNSLQF